MNLTNGRYQIDYSQSDCECDTDNPPVIVVVGDAHYCECPDCGEYIGNLEKVEE